MRRKIEFLRDFADIGEFFDLPMKTYCRHALARRVRHEHGLRLRLLPDRRGDGRWATLSSARRVRKLFAQRLANANVILVSHSMADIRKHCDMVVHVNRGNTVLYTDIEAGIAAYQLPETAA